MTKIKHDAGVDSHLVLTIETIRDVKAMLRGVPGLPDNVQAFLSLAADYAQQARDHMLPADTDPSA